MGSNDNCDLVRRFSGRRIAVVGDIAVDHYARGVIERKNPESDAPLVRVTDNSYALGCAGNVALNLASLGAQVTLFGRIGSDFYGDKVRALSESARVNLITVGCRETVAKLRTMSSDGPVSRTDFGEGSLSPLDEHQAAIILLEINSRNLDAVVISDYNKGLFSGNLGCNLVSLATGRDIPVFVDPKPANIEKFYGATLIRPNEKEARQITDISSGEGDVKEVVRRLRGLTRSSYAVVTRGPAGIIGYDGSGLVEFPSSARRVVDVTGAGDTVLSSLALSIVCGASLEQACLISNCAAGIAVEKPGTAFVSVDELLGGLG